MECRCIAFMLSESIIWKTAVQLEHQPVARHFGDHTGSRDAETQRISADQSRLTDGKWMHRAAVDQDVIRRNLQLLHGQPHGQMRCAQNI